MNPRTESLQVGAFLIVSGIAGPGRQQTRPWGLRGLPCLPPSVFDLG